MKLGLAIAAATLAAAPALAQDAEAFLQQTLRNGVAGFAGACLATAPDFQGISAAAGRAGFIRQDGMTVLPGSEARIEMMALDGGCACTTHLIAPDPNATAAAVFQAVLAAGPQVIEQPDTSSVLRWPGGDNVLQVAGDLRDSVPMLIVTLQSSTSCPSQ